MRNSPKQSCNASATLCEDIAQRSGAPTIGSCTMTMPTNEFLVKRNIPSLPHPPYSPDLAPCDFLFPQQKKTMKGHRFDYIEEIQANVTRQKVTTRGVFISGRNAGISAYKHKDATSKETRPTSR